MEIKGKNSVMDELNFSHDIMGEIVQNKRVDNSKRSITLAEATKNEEAFKKALAEENKKRTFQKGGMVGKYKVEWEQQDYDGNMKRYTKFFKKN